MIKRVTPVGDEMGLVIDKELLEALKITGDTDLDVSVEDGALVITPVGKKRRSRRRSPAVQPLPLPPPSRPRRSEPRYGFPKKQPW